MFKKVRAKSVREYLSAVPAERKEMILFLHNFILKTIPTLKSHFANSMLGYGTFKYKNYKKEIIDWPIIALANQKHYVSIYVCSVIDGAYVAERCKKELGNVKVGRSCISFRKLQDIHMPVLRRVLKEAARHPGLTKT